ncbi:protein of unknown function [Trichlorobacter ammonificans]|uniref:Uncharacterized protein n=1 Tax=Trichlorobacter ammonificans TaxID=2916410 RepID=A0ABM9D993_9BACT|nr:protein of unknown function [Trichlorobacter ammonificans]
MHAEKAGFERIRADTSHQEKDFEICVHPPHPRNPRAIAFDVRFSPRTSRLCVRTH